MNSSGRVPMTEFDRSGARLAFQRPPLNMSAGHRSGSDHGEPCAGGRAHVERGSVARIRSCYCRNAVDHAVVDEEVTEPSASHVSDHGPGVRFPPTVAFAAGFLVALGLHVFEPIRFLTGRNVSALAVLGWICIGGGCGALPVVAAGVLPRPNRDHVAEAGDRADAPGTVRVVAQSAVCRLRLRFTSGPRSSRTRCGRCFCWRRCWPSSFTPSSTARNATSSACSAPRTKRIVATSAAGCDRPARGPAGPPPWSSAG